MSNIKWKHILNVLQLSNSIALTPLMFCYVLNKLYMLPKKVTITNGNRKLIGKTKNKIKERVPTGQKQRGKSISALFYSYSSFRSIKKLKLKQVR